ncbi:Uncharacterised protein [Mycobacteroides abscessus subsp. abscessus]|nr:Uncharacterised protein [Mycobacteroides abscessus subsp. abscessus]
MCAANASEDIGKSFQRRRARTAKVGTGAPGRSACLRRNRSTAAAVASSTVGGTDSAGCTTLNPITSCRRRVSSAGSRWCADATRNPPRRRMSTGPPTACRRLRTRQFSNQPWLRPLTAISPYLASTQNPDICHPFRRR